MSKYYRTNILKIYALHSCALISIYQSCNTNFLFASDNISDSNLFISDYDGNDSSQTLENEFRILWYYNLKISRSFISKQKNVYIDEIRKKQFDVYIVLFALWGFRD